MPIASGAGHWPKEHVVSPVSPATPKPSGPGYIQSYMPQWVPPNKVQPPKTSYLMTGGNPPNPKSPYPSPNYPSGGQGNPGYDTPPPRYNSTTPNSPRGNDDYPPGGPRNGQPGNDGRYPPQPNQGRNPSYNSRSYEQRPPPARMFRASEKYGQAGHNRFGTDGLRPESDFGHNKYGVRYDSSRSVIVNSKGTRPVGPRGLESYEMYGPRMNMTTGLCGPQMRPLCALLGGLLALAALGGIIAGIALGVKSKTDSSTRKLAYVSPFKNVRYYQQNGVYEPCVDRYATTTAVRTTTAPTTTRKLTTAAATTTAFTCIPLTINTAKAVAPVTAAKTATTGKAATTTAQKTTTVCVITTPGPTTPERTTPETTTRPTTTVITTTPPLTTTTTLPFCDTLTTTYTLVTLYPLVLPPSTAATARQTFGVTAVMLVVVNLSAKRFVG